MSVPDLIRVGARGSAFVGLTMGIWVCMDTETLLSHDSERFAVLHKWKHRWAKTLLKIYGVQLEANGLHVGLGNPYPGRSPNGVGRVFIMNHRSGLDVIIMFAVTESHLVSRADLAQWPFIGHGAKRIGTLFVDRKSMRSGASVLKAMTRTLEQGRAVTIFPEGTAFAGDEVRFFRPGAFNAARRAGAEIVPMGIAHADEGANYGDESFLEHLRRVSAMRQHRVALEVGEPIVPGDEPLIELRDRCRETVQELVNRARARLS